VPNCLTACFPGLIEQLRLEALRLGKAHVALCHLRDPDSGEYNIPFLKRTFAADAIVAITLWHRRVGFVQRPTAPAVETFADLRRRSLRFVNRQRGSGVRWLIDHALQEAKIPPVRLKGYEMEVWTHWEVGLTVLRDRADVGVATESVARLFGLVFHEITEERFDLLVSKDHYFTKPVQALLATLTSSELRARATTLGGYDVRDIGKVVFPG
jgi:putative molybdopterin biosynthesis protein